MMRTMDISKFYDSVDCRYIYEMFSGKFRMETDIARLMTKLVTHNLIN